MISKECSLLPRNGAKVEEKLTVFERGNHSDECGIEGIPVVIYTCRVNVEDPCCFSGVNYEGRERQHS